MANSYKKSKTFKMFIYEFTLEEKYVNLHEVKKKICEMFVGNNALVELNKVIDKIVDFRERKVKILMYPTKMNKY